MVKTTAKFITSILGVLSTVIFPRNLYKYIVSFINLIYSARCANYVNDIGENVRFGFGSTILNGKYISIGNNVRIGKRSVITAWDKYGDDTFNPSIKIGKCTAIGDDCHITAINSITIGEGVLMGKKITISDNSHGHNIEAELEIPPIKRDLYSKGEVFISDNVWIGDKVTILANTHIGFGAIIAANAVVTKDVPSKSIVAGVPARVVKFV